MAKVPAYYFVTRLYLWIYPSTAEYMRNFFSGIYSKVKINFNEKGSPSVLFLVTT